MSNVYVHFSQTSLPARYSVVNFQLGSHSLRFREVIHKPLLRTQKQTTKKPRKFEVLKEAQTGFEPDSTANLNIAYLRGFQQLQGVSQFGVCKYLHFIANFVNDVQYFEQSCNTKCNTD